MDALYLACIWAAGSCIVLMSLFIPWGIFTRYVLGHGSQWPEPISILLMVVFTFMGAAAAYRAGAHIAVNMITDRLPDAAAAVAADVLDRRIDARAACLGMRPLLQHQESAGGAGDDAAALAVLARP